MKKYYPYLGSTMPFRLILFYLLLVCGSILYAQSQYVTPDGEGGITFTPGLRIQVRYNLDQTDDNNDIFIRRLRLKGNGKFFDLGNYYFEVKIDNAGRFDSEPKAQVENAWLNFPLFSDIDIRVGLYDMVFSRNALTSDSKLLLMDRSLIMEALTVLGIADNTVGILIHGRPLDGHLSYGFGIFDNLGFENPGTPEVLARQADGAMSTGRLVYDFLDPAPSAGYADYRGSYIGQGQRLSLGANGAYLTKAQIGSNKFDLYAWGVDLFFNTGPVTVEVEYNAYTEANLEGESSTLVGSGWYAQAGYLLFPVLELAARYQELDPDDHNDTDKISWTTFGLNYYIRNHNLKIQTDYTFKNEQSNGSDNNLLQAQLQLDF